jgi:dUTP pyrophosphatase
MAELHIKLDDESLDEFYMSSRANFLSDSGFDLYVPNDVTIAGKSTVKIDMGIIVEPQFNGGYYLYPRSSISKTPLRLANSVGIIDNGYRGHIMVVVDNISDKEWDVKRGERLFQLCHPTLEPLSVKVVDEVDMKTDRGVGGFGSTNETPQGSK